MLIAGQYRDMIQRGELVSGDTMPSAKTISQEHGVAVETARKSLRVLEAEHLIERVPGLPFFVV
jgi:DNA-binding GntR family transcriptional regulator